MTPASVPSHNRAAMPRPLRRRFASAGPLLATGAMMLVAPALGACAEDDLFSDCPLSNSIQETCESGQASTDLTCVVAEHPFCNEKICARYKGSAPFCSRSCSGDADCPGGSGCATVEKLGLSFCVQDALLDDATVAR